MKILMINAVCGVGSTGKICTDLAEILEKEGHQVKIAYGRGTVSERFKRFAIKIGSNLGTYMHAGLSKIFDTCGIHSKIATKKFIKWVKKFDPDIIHIFSPSRQFVSKFMLPSG